jgi:hypothetical protein
LEKLINKVQLKGKQLILCGDWNVNFLHDNVQLQALQSLLQAHNLSNVVTTPTRITKNTSSLIDFMILNIQLSDNLIKVMDVGYSGHLVQVLNLLKNQ